jgi:hypothetical protein
MTTSWWTTGDDRQGPDRPRRVGSDGATRILTGSTFGSSGISGAPPTPFSFRTAPFDFPDLGAFDLVCHVHRYGDDRRHGVAWRIHPMRVMTPAQLASYVGRCATSKAAGIAQPARHPADPRQGHTRPAARPPSSSRRSRTGTLHEHTFALQAQGEELWGSVGGASGAPGRRRCRRGTVRPNDRDAVGGAWTGPSSR